MSVQRKIKKGRGSAAGAGFRIGVEEGLIDPKRTVQVGLRGPMGLPIQDDWSLAHFTVLYYRDMIARGMGWAVSEIRRVVGNGPTYLTAGWSRSANRPYHLRFPPADGRPYCRPAAGIKKMKTQNG